MPTIFPFLQLASVTQSVPASNCHISDSTPIRVILFVFICKQLRILFKCSLASKVESRKLAGALDSCFILLGNPSAMRTNGVWWEPNSQPNSLETKSLIVGPQVAVLVCYAYTHTNLQLPITVDFIHQMCITNQTMEDNSRFIPIGEFGILSRERAPMAQRLENCFLSCVVAGSIPNMLRRCALLKTPKNTTKQLSSVPSGGFSVTK